jgi:HAD superfamily hydrolase (TIGR01509 family)
MKLSIPDGPFKAYLFDCDGTIVDSMPLHYIAWKKMLPEWEKDFPEDLFYSLGGMPTAEIVALLNERNGTNMPPVETALKKEEIFYEILHELKAIPEVVEHIEATHGQIPFAVVSGGTRDAVTRSLDALGLLDRFETLICAGDYENAKPHPEPYLMAAKRLGVAPEECLVFEDTDMGIQSATAAGMASVKIPQPWERVAQTTAAAASK